MNKSYLPDQIKLLKRILYSYHTETIRGIIFYPPKDIISFLEENISEKKKSLQLFIYAFPHIQAHINKNEKFHILKVLNDQLNFFYYVDIVNVWKKNSFNIDHFHLLPASYDEKKETYSLPALEFPFILEHPERFQKKVKVPEILCKTKILLFPNELFCEAIYNINVAKLINNEKSENDLSVIHQSSIDRIIRI